METKISNFKLPEETKIQLREISNDIGENMTQTLILIIEKIYKNNTDRDILKNMDAREKVIESIMRDRGVNREEAEQLRIMSIVYTKKRNRVDDCTNSDLDINQVQKDDNTDAPSWEELMRMMYEGHEERIKRRHQ